MMDNSHAISFLGIGTMSIGAVGICITVQACREASAIPCHAGRRHVLGAMLFLMGANLLITGLGCWVTLLDTRIDGGAHG